MTAEPKPTAEPKAWSDLKRFVMTALSALVVGALLAVLNHVLAMQPRTARPDAIGTPSAIDTAPSGVFEPNHLSDDQIRRQIGPALQADDVAGAIELMNGLQPSAKAEECKRVLEFCLRNPTVDRALDRARVLVDRCLTGRLRTDALQKIDMIRRKEQ